MMSEVYLRCKDLFGPSSEMNCDVRSYYALFADNVSANPETSVLSENTSAVLNTEPNASEVLISKEYSVTSTGDYNIYCLSAGLSLAIIFSVTLALGSFVYMRLHSAKTKISNIEIAQPLYDTLSEGHKTDYTIDQESL